MRRLVCCAVAFAAALAFPASAQDYPSKPIHMIIPFGVGGGTDVLARLLADPLAKKLGQPVVPDNRPGAGGNLGAAQVAKAAPDGYTILFGNDSLVSAKFLFRNLGFDPQSDLAPVASVALTSYALLSSPQFPANDLAEFLSVVRANPGKYSYASPGPGSGPHVAFEMIKSTGNLDIVHAPFKSGSEALAAVMRNETQFTLHSLTIAAENPGKVKGLGITADARSSLMPDAATFKEVGVDISASSWFGVLAPAKTPKPIIDKLNSAINETLALPNVKAAYEKIGYEVRPMTPEQFAAYFAGDFPKFGAAISKAGIQPSD
jgi:tripartite-type tricarboxylate transporter receptor subunit TctC